MLKDVQDSQRMNRHIKDQLTKKEVVDDSIDFDAFILSGVYWPAFKDDQVKAPGEIERYAFKTSTKYCIIMILCENTNGAKHAYQNST